MAVAVAVGSSAESVGGGGASLPRNANTAKAPPTTSTRAVATMINRRAMAPILADPV